MPGPLRTNPSHKGHNVVTEFPNFELHSAAASGNQGLVEYALSRGQPVNSVIDGVLPLHAACGGGHEQIVKVLIERGADVNAPRLPRRYSNDKSKDAPSFITGTPGSTPLHFAAANGNKSVMMTLLLHGAHPNITDRHGVTPAALAEQNGWVECATILTEWMTNKDRDLRERGKRPSRPDEVGQTWSAGNNRERNASFGNDEDASGSTRKRLQVKRSIDTALNKLKASGGSVTQQRPLLISTSSNRLPILTPPTSPRRRDRSPSYSEEGHDPGTYDNERRRPSLPHVLQPPTPTSPSGHQLRNYKSATPVKPPRSPRRPGSAGNGADGIGGETEVDSNTAKAPGRKLGTKLSLMNIFKKGNETTGVPSERTSSAQVSSSASMPISIPSSQASSSWNVSSISSSPKQSPKQSSMVESRPGPLPQTGYRFGGSDNSTRQHSPSLSSSSITQSSPLHNKTSQPYSPPRHQIALAVDLHNALAAQQYQANRERSGSNSSTNGLGITLDGTSEGGGSISSSPLNRMMHRIRPGHVRDRSGSDGSNRNFQVFDDEVYSPESSGKTFRPGILRGHHRTSSSGQASVLRALRFDSTSSTSSRRGDADNPPLRGCTSASSLRRVVEYPSNRGQQISNIPPDSSNRIPDSAPATVGDFDTSPRVYNEDLDNSNDDIEESYGQPLENTTRSTLAQTRGRGLSFASSDSLSPVLPADTVSTLKSEFPFSIDQPPPSEDVSTNSRLLKVPPPDGRGRGDSVSSTSTTDSFNPALSASGTTSGSGGSATVTTPLRSPERSSFLDLSVESPMSSNFNVESYRDPTKLSSRDDGVVTLNERRSRSGLGINLNLAVSHARAERRVQQTKEDILSAHNDDGEEISSVATTQMPLSARLAALGESLEIERALREQKQAHETALKVSLTPPNGGRVLRESLDTVIATASPGVIRQSSLNTGSTPKRKEPRRPHTSSGTASPTTPDASNSLVGKNTQESPARTRPGHQSSHSASAVEITAIGAGPSIVTSGKRSLTPDLTDIDSNLSRMSSLEGMDTDTEFGIPLHRVNTAPNSSKGRRERDLASATKLTRMGIIPNTTPNPPKRFGFKSLVQTFKGR